MGYAITSKELKKQVKKYNANLLPRETRITEAEYLVINKLIRISKRMKPAKITEARLRAIIDKDRQEDEIKTVRDIQCESCYHRIYHKSDLSHVDICNLNLDMDRLARHICTEWCMTREHGLKIVDAMAKLAGKGVYMWIGAIVLILLLLIAIVLVR